MRRILLAGLPVVFFLIAAAIGATSQGPYPETERALQAELGKLGWVAEPGTYRLNASSSSVTVDGGRPLLFGQDANRALFLLKAVEFRETEAILYDDESGVMVTFEFLREGFVRDTDWRNIDADRLLATIRARTGAANIERAKYGIEPEIALGWVDEPRYDAATNAVSWAIGFAKGKNATVTATALKLGRHGYQKFSWIGPRDQYERLGGLLTTALESHAFDAGHR